MKRFLGLIACALVGAGPVFSQLEASLQKLAGNRDGEGADLQLEAIAELESYPEKALVSEIFDAYRGGALYLWDDRVVMSSEIFEDENYVKYIRPIDIVTKDFLRDAEFSVPLRSVIELKPSRDQRAALASAQIAVKIGDPGASGRAAAIRRAVSDSRAPEFAAVLKETADSDPDPRIRFLAEESFHIITLSGSASLSEITAAVRRLGELKSLRAQPLLLDLASSPPPDRPAAESEPEPSLEQGLTQAVTQALTSITRYRRLVDFIDILKAGISTGSILILVALGLSVTFGLMGIINMAHGEMLMIGAYTTYCIQLLFGHSPENPAPLFFIAAVPSAFIAAALAGALVEWSIVRRLYNRPVESLLATYGVSLVLVQTVRLIFGDNRAVNTPERLQGAMQIAQGITLPFNRIFVLFIAVLCVTAVYMVFRFSRSGMEMKAAMQNRPMASAMGINTRKVDSLTFMLGSGIAGIAGCAVTTLSGITPGMGKNYLIDSFLVVVTGGVGSLGGIVISGAGIGFINKILEGTVFGTVWAKILVLTLVVLFIQYRPTGIFPPKGRAADD